MSHFANRRSASYAGVALIASAALVLASCGSSSEPAGDGSATSTSEAASSSTSSASGVEQQDPKVLRIAVPAAPASLDPALSGSADPLSLFPELAYESLIDQDPSGDFVPGLATKWEYTDDQNKVFELTLREGVKFSDGGELTAQGVKDFFEYYHNAGGGFASRIDNFASMDVIDPLHLTITLKEPDPLMPFNLSPRMVTGAVISPTALADPSNLGTSTAGAGQYVLDDKDTVQGQKYVYTASPTYYDQSKINWERVEIDVIPDSSNQLNAMRANQIDYMFGTPKNADAAKADGFDVYTQPQAFLHVQLLDRSGEKTAALGDERVRQALNYAIDRDAIAKGLFGEYGSAGSQMAVEGTDGFDPALEGFYTYDVDKAKQLLSDAGYADGFTFDMAAFNLQPGIEDAAQAIAAYWSAIGVTANIVVPTAISELVSLLSEKKVEAQVFQYGSRPMLSSMGELLKPGGTFNPYGVSDPTVDELLSKLAVADEATGTEIAHQLEKKILELGWFVPVANIDKVVISRPGLTGGEMNGRYLNPIPTYFTASK